MRKDNTFLGLAMQMFAQSGVSNPFSNYRQFNISGRRIPNPINQRRAWKRRKRAGR